MQSRERRACLRFTLNHPVLMGTGEDWGHLAEIIDAGVEGMRVRMTNQSGFQVGHEVDIACLSRQDQADTVNLRCRVAWEDAENLEVGLTYLQ
ncbi:MAG: PilZ domain-containing protein [Desulfobulbaceae bacterium]|nr:PilZ domain-containing protein [Desulfobulbaceae bacterium]